jgi:hypothetical protein
MARIDTPTDGDRSSSPVTVAGVAWAPTAGIERVEVSLDGHPWQPADLAAELAPSAWRRWRLIADLDPGTHRIQARAVSRTGDVQDATPNPRSPPEHPACIPPTCTSRPRHTTSRAPHPPEWRAGNGKRDARRTADPMLTVLPRCAGSGQHVVDAPADLLPCLLRGERVLGAEGDAVAIPTAGDPGIHHDVGQCLDQRSLRALR